MLKPATLYQPIHGPVFQYFVEQIANQCALVRATDPREPFPRIL